MTLEELNDKLVKHSPFRIVGRSGNYSFTGKNFAINDVIISGYKICQGDGRHYRMVFDNGFYTMLNYKISIAKDVDFPIVINYDKRNLAQNGYRDRNAVNGYFVLESGFSG